MADTGRVVVRPSEIKYTHVDSAALTTCRALHTPFPCQGNRIQLCRCRSTFCCQSTASTGRASWYLLKHTKLFCNDTYLNASQTTTTTTNIQPSQVPPHTHAHVQVINQVAAASIGTRLDCDAFAETHSSTSHYDRASFVGLAVRTSSLNLHVTIFDFTTHSQLFSCSGVLLQNQFAAVRKQKIYSQKTHSNITTSKTISIFFLQKSTRPDEQASAAPHKKKTPHTCIDFALCTCTSTCRVYRFTRINTHSRSSHIVVTHGVRTFQTFRKQTAAHARSRTPSKRAQILQARQNRRKQQQIVVINVNIAHAYYRFACILERIRHNRSKLVFRYI